MVPIPPAPISSRTTYWLTALNGVSLTWKFMPVTMTPAPAGVPPSPARALRQERHEFGQFGVEVGVVVHGLRDARDQDLPELAPQPVDGDLRGRLGQAGLLGDLLVRRP